MYRYRGLGKIELFRSTLCNQYCSSTKVILFIHSLAKQKDGFCEWRYFASLFLHRAQPVVYDFSQKLHRGNVISLNVRVTTRNRRDYDCLQTAMIDCLHWNFTFYVRDSRIGT